MPGPKEQVPADPSWTRSEVWVWERLQAGDIADLDQYEDEQGQLPPADPNKQEEWQDGRRRLSAPFVEAILLREPFRGVLHRKGVRIEGAWFCEEIDLELAEVTCVLWLDRCRFEQRLNLAYLKANSNVTFDGSAFVNQVDMQGARLRGNLFLRSVTALKSFTLRTARIDGLLHCAGAKIRGALDMNGVDVGLGLSLGSTREIPGGDSEFTKVNLIGAKVRGQVNLKGATVTGMLAIDGASIEHDLLMGSHRGASERQAEFASISMRGTRIRGQLALVGAKTNGVLAIDRAEIGQDLVMHTDLATSNYRASYKDVDLRGINVQGQINLTGAQVDGNIILNSATVGQSLLMSSNGEVRAEFGNVTLQGAVIGGTVTMIGTKVVDTLDLTLCDIRQMLDMSVANHISIHRSEFDLVLLRGANIGGQLNLSGAKIAGALEMDGIKVGKGVFLNYDPSFSRELTELGYVNLSRARIDGGLGLRGASAKGKVVAIAADIEGDVFLGGCGMGPVDLHGTRIRGELNFARPTPDWPDQRLASWLNLRNASCDAVQDGGELGVWPECVELDGFTYQRFGGLGADPEADVVKRTSSWFISWLAKDKSYSPQPYHQCAKVLREMGHPEMANDILYEGRERERHEIWAPWPDERGSGAQARLSRSLHWLGTMLAGRHPFPWYEEIYRSLRWLGLSLLASFVGYGYGSRLLWRPLIWAVLTIAIGVRVTYSDASGFPDSSFWWRSFFSLDMLLPIVELSREHTLVQAGLDGLAYGWFVIHRLFGWVLALFLIAGLTGLTR